MSSSSNSYKSPAALMLRRLSRAALVVLAILVIAYFVVTSGAFLKAVVLPRVSEGLHANVSVADVSLRGLSALELRQLKVETTGPQPLFQAERVFVRVGRWALLTGGLLFREIVIEAPAVTLVQQADGKSNLDPLFERKPGEAGSPPRTQPLDLRIESLTLSKGSARYSRIAADGSSQTSEAADLEIVARNVAAGMDGDLKFGATLSHVVTPAPGGSNGTDRLQVKSTATLDFKVDQELRPARLKGEARLEVPQALGAFKDLTGLSGVLACEVTATDVRELAMRFEKSGKKLGAVRLSGPIDLPKSEARLKLEVTAIDRNVLNLFGAPLGLDFADTTLSASSIVDISRRGDTLTARGEGTATKFSVRQARGATPPVDLALDYQFTINRNDNSAVVYKLGLVGRQGGRELLSTSLDRPMYLSWGQVVQGLNDSVIKVAVNDLRLGDWRAFLGTNAPDGKVNATCKLTCQQDGRRIGVEMNASVTDLTAALASYRLRQGEVRFQSRALFTDYRSLLMEQYSLQVAEQGTQLLSATGAAGYDLSSGDASLQVVLESDLPKILSQFPVPGLSATMGRITLDGLVAREKGQQRAGLNLGLSGFNGGYGDYRFNKYEARLGFDAELTDKYLNLRRVQLTARQGTDAASTVDLGGKYDRILEGGDFVLSIENLTESALQPLVAPLLEPRQLVSVKISGTGKARYDARNRSLLTLDTEVTRLHLRDPGGAFPDAPLDLQLQLEAGYLTNRLDLTKLVVALTPTPRARNQLTVQGTANLARTNAITGQLKLTAESLDFTPWYDALATNRPAAKPPATAQAAAPTEPPALLLPVEQFVANLQIDRLFVRDLAVSNWTATAQLNRNVLTVDPCKLVLNGGPAGGTATLDLGKVGYVYDLKLKADQVPLEPLANTFAPDRRGQLKGDLYADVAFSGAGMTGPSLQRTLLGKFNLGSTNLTLALSSVRSSLLKSVINVVIGIPELVRNPAAALGNLLGQLGGATSAGTSGWVDEFSKSPIETIQVQANAGNGRVELQQALVQSAAFQAQARGVITLAPVPTNSTLQVPVTIALRRALAEKAGLLPANTPTNTLYVKLPEFLTMEGTLGDPKSKINHLALVAVTAKAGSGLIGNTGNANLDKASGVLNAVGSLLGGGSGAPASPPATNTAGAKGTNAAPSTPFNPLDLFKKK